MRLKKRAATKLTPRPYRPEDYATISKWWADRGWDPVPPNILSKHGAIIEHKGKPVASGFAYKMGAAPAAYLGWIVSDPDAENSIRGPAVEQVLKVLEQMGRDMGATILMTCSNHEGLNSRFRSQGFFNTDEQVTTLLKRL